MAISLGESQFREFKSAQEGPPGSKVPRDCKEIAQDIAKTLVAFANADGGELLVGIEDDGEVTGVPHSSDHIEHLKRAPFENVLKTTPLPQPLIQQLILDGATILYFVVACGNGRTFQTSDGKCPTRFDRESLPINAESIRSSQEERESREWDRTFEPSASIADLDFELISRLTKERVHTSGVSVEAFLQYLNLIDFSVDGFRIRRAALLLFAKDVQRWHPRCEVRIRTYKTDRQGTGDSIGIVRERALADNVVNLISLAWDELINSISHSLRLTNYGKFEEAIVYPREACLEVLINAIVHRNYAISGRGIEIDLYPNRMEITSPGILLKTIRLDDLKKQKGSHDSRNVLIARVLRESGHVREMGEGMRRIYLTMKSRSLQEPELMEDSAVGFRVTLFNKKTFSAEVSVWLTQYNSLGLVEEQKAILLMGFENKHFSTQDVLDSLGIDVGRFQELTTPLLKQGVLVRTRQKSDVHKEARRKGLRNRDLPIWTVAPLDHTGKTARSRRRPAQPHHPKDLNPRAVASKRAKRAVENLQPSDFAEAIELKIQGIPKTADYNELRSHLMGIPGFRIEKLFLSRPNIFARIFLRHNNKGYAFVTLNSNLDRTDLVTRISLEKFRNTHLFIKIKTPPRPKRTEEGSS